MYITASKMRNFTMYRKLNLDFESITSKGENKKKNSLVYLMTTNFFDSKKVLYTNLFRLNYIKGYYIPKRLDLNSVQSKRVNMDQFEQYIEIRKDFPLINQQRNSVENYNQYNFYYDMSYEISSYLNQKRYSGKQKLQNLANTIKEINSRESLNKYKERIMIIPILSSNPNIENYFSDDNTNMASMVYNMIRYKYLTKEDLNNITLIFFNHKERYLFKIPNTLNPLDISKMKKLIDLNLKLNLNKELDDEESSYLSSLDDNLDELKKDKTSLAVIHKQNLKDDISNAIRKAYNIDKRVNSVTGENDEIMDNIEDLIEDRIDNSGDDISESDIVSQLEKDEEFIKYMEDLTKAKMVGQRNELKIADLDKKREMQDNVDINGKTLKEVIASYKSKSIDLEEIPVETGFDHIKYSKLKDFDRNYNEKQMDKDTLDILSHFSNDKELPIFVKDIKREDSSDDFNKKETITVTFEDSEKGRHTFKIDVPKIIDDKFLYLNGGKKSIVKQILFLPVVKVKPDAVKMTSNYNILFLTRFGGKSSPNSDRLKKFISAPDFKANKYKLKLANNTAINSEYENSLEYDEVASYLDQITLGTITLDFNRKRTMEKYKALKDSDYKVNHDNEIIIGFNGKALVVNNKDDNNIYFREPKKKDEMIGHGIIDGIVNLGKRANDSTFEEVYEVKVGKRYAYSRIRIIGRSIPLILTLGLMEGLENVMKKYGIDYEFVEKRKRLTPYEKSITSEIKFKDGYMYYPSIPLRYSLLMNGLIEVNTKEYTLDSFNDETAYLEILNDMYGSRNIAKGILNMYHLFLDPITKEILEDMNLPTEYVELMLYANSLLENKSYKRGNDLTNYRIRSNEIINAYMYRVLADSFRQYKDTRKAGSPIKVSAPQDKLIKNLLEDPLINDYSTLNPFLESQEISAATYRGISGINQSDAIQIDTRSYDESMLRLFAMSSPDSDKVGVVRYLTYNPKLTNTRGIIENETNIATTKQTEMASVVELLSPFTQTHADPQRAQMQSIQAKHIMPTVKQNKVLVGSGIEKTIAHTLSSDFIFKAKEDGKVLSIDDKLDIMTIQYKSGKIDTVDLSSVSAKNSNGGFYISNKKDATLAPGKSFKKDKILAKNSQYFLDSMDSDDPTLTSGRLAKVAFMSGDYTFEDSCIITNTLSNDMASLVTMKKVVKLGKNATIEKIVKKGDQVKTSQVLMAFEQSFEDAASNQVLSNLGDEFQQAIGDFSKTTITSKYTGTVVNVKLYYNQEIEEFSPSIQKLLKSYINEVERKRKIVQSADYSHNYILPPVAKINPDQKINGEEFEGIMIEFYIEYEDKMKIGDKVTFSVALKSIVADVIDDGEEPYSETRPNEPIDAMMAPISITNRMTVDIFYQFYMNKLLIELKEKVRDIYNS